MPLDADKILEALSVIREAEKYDLNVAPWDQEEDVRQAIELLNSETPMKVRWPDGQKAVGPFRPRQVISLCDGWGARVTHEDEAYREAHSRIIADLEKQDTRVCEGTTKAGSPCSANSLPYIERARCHAHATTDEREHNKSMQKREREMLEDAIAEIGMRRVME